MRAMVPGDLELWQLARDGDGSAFGQLFDRHATAVYNHLFRQTANWSEAEDLTSAVFLLAWRKRGKVVLDRESALPWLLGIANHTARNAARASRRYRAALARLYPDERFSPDPADAVAAAVDSERRMAELRTAVDRLPRHEREVIELCAWSGLDLRAAAVALGVPLGTVKSRMHRARQRLAATLADAPASPPRPADPSRPASPRPADPPRPASPRPADPPRPVGSPRPAAPSGPAAHAPGEEDRWTLEEDRWTPRAR